MGTHSHNTNKSGSWKTASATGSWSFASSFSMTTSSSASATTSSSSSAPKKKKPERTKPLPSYNVPETHRIGDSTESTRPKAITDGKESNDSDTSEEHGETEDTTDSQTSPPPNKKPDATKTKKTKKPKRSKDGQGPTVKEPFNFEPVDDSFTVAECSDDEDDENEQPLIAIPQTQATPTSPLVTGYPPSLHDHGISKQTWASFLDTVNGFLEASVSKSAVDHAMDVAAHVGQRPKKLAGGLAARAGSIGQEIGNSAARGNVVGVTAGIIKGAISLPLNLVFTTTSAVLGLPITVANAASKKPPTARQRATAYLAVANEEWLVPRRLFAGLLDTTQLGDLMGLPVSKLPVVEEEDENGTTYEETQYSMLRERAEELEAWGETAAQLGPNTLWLVLTQVVS